jgi:hypothetical protein
MTASTPHASAPWLAAFAAALLVCSGSSAASDAAWDKAEAEIAACFQAMDADPALAVVNAKFARRNPTAAQLADVAIPSEDEAEALRLRVKKTRPCRGLRLAAVNEYHPLLEPAYATLYYQADQVFSYLQQRTITYGTANRLSAESLDLFRARERAYFAAPEAERAALADVWRDQLQRGHSNPPPYDPQSKCSWSDLNIACE